MQFVNIPFPERIAFGAQASAEWNTTVVTVYSGRDDANPHWSQDRASFDVSLAVRNASDFQEAKAHFHQVRARAKAFPFKDFLDYTVTQAEGVTSSSSPYKLFKRYGTGADAYDKRITRPVPETIAIFRTRSSTTTNVTADATLGDLGTFTVTGHVGGDVYSWSGAFNLPCRYDTDKLSAVAINKEPGDDGELLVQCDSIPVLEVREDDEE